LGRKRPSERLLGEWNVVNDKKRQRAHAEKLSLSRAMCQNVRTYKGVSGNIGRAINPFSVGSTEASVGSIVEG